MDTQHPQYLEPSELGTKEYWETYYERSLEHIASKTKTRTNDTTTHNAEEDENADENGDEEEEEDDDDDPGTSWFSEHDAPQKILRFLTSRKFPLSPRNVHRKKGGGREPSILDLGTGNGSMLALLRKRGGFGGVMVGVDYSEQSVRLARELQRLRLHSAYESGDDSDYDDDDEEEEDDDDDDEEQDVVVATSTGNAGDDSLHREEGIPLKNQDIQFEEWDILDPTNETILDNNNDATKRLSWFPYESQGFDIVLDKGTFDAISLSDETTASANTHICHQYPVVASKLVRPGGYLIVTSCNWTEDELVHWFTTATQTAELEVWHRLEYPRFRFGGMEGQGVCTVCFRKKE